MAREFARVKLGIWDDDDFRDLPVTSQHLYFILLTSPSLTYCGTVDWRPARLSGMAGDWTKEQVETAAYTLAERRYVVIDESTEEALIRSFIRHDGLMMKPRMAVSMVNAHRAVASITIRGVIVHELLRLHEEDPSLGGWSDIHGKPGVALDLLEREPIDPAEVAADLPSVCPSVCTAFVANASSRLHRVCTPSTPAPAPATADQQTATSAIAIADAPRADVEGICEHLANAIEANGSKRPTITTKWRQAARLMLDKDGRTEEEVHGAIEWSQRDEFWRANILSLPTLREKYDTLRLQAQRKTTTGGGSRNAEWREMQERQMQRAVEREREMGLR